MIEGFGISVNRWEPENVLKALDTGLVDAVQVVYNVFDQAPEDELFPACRDSDVAVIARVPFDEGSLTGTLTATRWPKGDWRNLYFTPEQPRARRFRTSSALTPLVPPGSSLPDLALRFILHHPAVSTTIPGMRRCRTSSRTSPPATRPPLGADSDQGPPRPSLGADLAGTVAPSPEERKIVMPHSRRSFLTGTAAAAVAATWPATATPAAAMDPVKRAGPARLRIGLAAYSMRQYLQAKPGAKGAMDLLGFVDWAATLDTDSVELT